MVKITRNSPFSCEDLLYENDARLYVPRLVEEIKSECEVKLTVEDVYMNTVFEELVTCVIKRGRGIEDKEPFTFDAVSVCIIG